jgi:hypothetical protein
MAPMTPEDEARIHELPKLIANEKDPDKVEILAAELEHLLRMLLESRKKLPTDNAANKT